VKPREPRITGAQSFVSQQSERRRFDATPREVAHFGAGASELKAAVEILELLRITKLSGVCAF